MQERGVSTVLYWCLRPHGPPPPDPWVQASSPSFLFPPFLDHTTGCLQAASEANDLDPHDQISAEWAQPLHVCKSYSFQRGASPRVYSARYRHVNSCVFFLKKSLLS